MASIVEDLQTVTTTGGVNGHVIDTAYMDRLVYEVRWSFAGTPSALIFNPFGTNDVGITPDVWFDHVIAVGADLTVSGTQVNATLQAAGRGIIIINDPARYTSIDTYFSGTSGSITLRAFGWTH